MKIKIVSAVLFVGIAAFTLYGCANEEAADVMLTEENTTGMLGAAPSISEQYETTSSVSQDDAITMRGLYTFVNENIQTVTQAQFETWEITYLDITGDGTEEAVLVSSYDKAWTGMLEIVSNDSGVLQRVLSDVPLGADGTAVDLQNGILAVTVSDGGTGLQYTDMGLYVYTGEEVVNALGGLTMSYVMQSDDIAYENSAFIDGDYTDFIYTLIRYDDVEKRQTVEKKSRYVYNAVSHNFDEQPLEAVITPPQNPADFTYEIRDGDLAVKYDGMENSIVLIKAGFTYDLLMEDKQEPVLIQKTLSVLSAYSSDRVLNFNAKAEITGSQLVCYIDMRTLEIHWLKTISLDRQDEPAVRLIDMLDESIRGEQIQYSNNSLVIVPYYPADGMNEASLNAVVVEDDTQGPTVSFAVFGTLENVTITRYDSSRTDVGEWTFSAFENTRVDILSSLASQDAFYGITGQIYVGKGLYVDISFAMDAIREASEYDVVQIS